MAKQNRTRDILAGIIISMIIVGIGVYFLEGRNNDGDEPVVEVDANAPVMVENYYFDYDIISIKPDSALCDIGGRTVYIYTIDSCEYIGSLDYGGKTLTHRARCKYCIERNK